MRHSGSLKESLISHLVWQRPMVSFLSITPSPNQVRGQGLEDKDRAGRK
jgi:hypothetical protein